MIWLSVYAACVATIGALWQIRIWWNDHTHIKVTTNFAIAPGGVTGSEILITITAVNSGRLSVYMEGAGFVIEGGLQLLPREGMAGTPNSPLPCDLLPGRRLTVYIPAQILLSSLIEDNHGLPPREAWFRDATGKEYVKRVNPNHFKSWVNLL